jgi:predicted dinucleotide-binding enzyme
MKIGIIGTGNMGRALGLRWASAGHEVLFGSRDPAKAEAVAASAPGMARAGDFDAAAAFGTVILYSVRDVLPSRLLRSPELLVLDGKIVIDCNNSDILGVDVPDPERRPGLHFIPPVPSIAERLAADVPRARVVNAFNTVPAPVVEREREALRSHRVSVFLCADDARAKSVVVGLAEEAGFVGVDSGELERAQLERAQLVEGLADFLRFQILELGRGPHATVSVQVLSDL